jgi:phenylpropionate dioxygenase-like ring-hydroxylating dioxygenase large terminal subunit
MHTIFEIAQGAKIDGSRTAIEEQIANEGFRGHWYPLTASSNVGAKPVSLDRMGERIVLWRETDGTVHAQEDRCPHRGARLSQGRVIDSTIVCPYHGISIDGDGRIASVPALPGCPIEGRLAVRTYAVEEIAGAIFAYFPTPAGEAPTPLGPPPEFTDPSWSHFVCETTWQTNYRYAIENVIDPMHGPYLHGDSHTMQYGIKDDIMEITDTETGFRVSRKLQKDVAFDWTEYGETGGLWMKLDIPYPAKNGPGGPFRSTSVPARFSSGGCVRSPAGSAICGASCIANALKRATTRCSNKTAPCSKAWPTTRAITRSYISTISASRDCAGASKRSRATRSKPPKRWPRGVRRGSRLKRDG